MFWNRFLLPSIIFLGAVSFLHWVAIEQGYYYTTNWYDFMMHFLGGFAIALLSLWIVNLPGMARFGRFVTPQNLFILAFSVGVAWEIYEIAFGLTSFQDKNYMWDTAHDLIMDSLGAYLAIFLSKKHIKIP
ncbi:hypothetical protein KW799_02170 [Candidatus Parcubacteria bacterium]|nr:hypothetical protein [Candidatus Parcubacteria bacterium]